MTVDLLIRKKTFYSIKIELLRGYSYEKGGVFICMFVPKDLVYRWTIIFFIALLPPFIVTLFQTKYSEFSIYLQ